MISLSENLHGTLARSGAVEIFYNSSKPFQILHCDNVCVSVLLGSGEIVWLGRMGDETWMLEAGHGKDVS